MRKSHILVSALFAVLAFSAVMGASSALAATAKWLVNGAAPASATAVLSVGVGTLLLTDMGVPAAVECTGADVLNEGTVGPNGEDATTAVEFKESSTNCKPAAKAENLKSEMVANGCESVKAVAAVDLPWLTELFKEGSVYLDRIASDGKGEPGYLVECKTLLGNVDDTCTEVSGKSTVEVKNEASDVNVLFPLKPANEATENAKCSVGGAENGLVFGEVLIEVMGGTLAASEE